MRAPLSLGSLVTLRRAERCTPSSSTRLTNLTGASRSRFSMELLKPADASISPSPSAHVYDSRRSFRTIRCCKWQTRRLCSGKRRHIADNIIVIENNFVRLRTLKLTFLGTVLVCLLLPMIPCFLVLFYVLLLSVSNFVYCAVPKRKTGSQFIPTVLTVSSRSLPA
ncbi:unnamed protein product [Nesidiocoris tenuis]|uniref:Uncharacterized protein n=1 Tax=Nesidiocoris tenuis TaxID=355587 RepID=A0A6H5GKL1_9HEMI|nr:unnamed protein product [Nesidiocoris tenuis]